MEGSKKQGSAYRRVLTGEAAWRGARSMEVHIGGC